MSTTNEHKGRANSVDQWVSQRLKMRRIMLGLSQQDLSEAVSVSIQQVQKYEKATNRISSGKLYAFAKFLKVPVSYFFEKDEDVSNNTAYLVAEEASPYDSEDKEIVTEKEVLSLIKAFAEVKNYQSRKKIIELVRTMA